MRFHCPQCGFAKEIPDRFKNRALTCPQCRHSQAGATPSPVSLASQTETILFYCHTCGFRKTIPFKFSGATAKCPQCRTQVLVTDYRDYWNLTRSPFPAGNHPDFFFEGYDHVEALERLFYIVEDGDMHFGLLTGDIGCGKTLTRLVFKKKLFNQNYELVDLENANLTFPFLLLEILQSLGAADSFADRPIDNSALFYLLREFKKVLKDRIHAKGKRLLIMLDEAQQLDQQTMIELKNLTNITLGHQCPVTIILIGQPDLRDLVKTLPQVDQRISLRYHLPPLRPQEIADYVHHRLAVAGNQRTEIFAPDTADSLHRITGGVPREINRVCKLALARACTMKSRVVDADMLESIALDLRRQDGLVAP